MIVLYENLHIVTPYERLMIESLLVSSFSDLNLQKMEKEKISYKFLCFFMPVFNNVSVKYLLSVNLPSFPGFYSITNPVLGK